MLELRATEKQLETDLVEQGHVERIEFDPQSVEQMKVKAKAMWQDLAGQLYPQSLLDEVLASLKEYRAQKPANKSSN